MKEVDATLENQELLVNVTIGSTVTLRKLYGPRDFCDIRVRLDYERCQWIIERKEYVETEDGELTEEIWLEEARVNGQ